MSVIKSFYYFITDLYRQRYIISQLVKRDFQNKYLASYLGLPWAFIQPIVSVVVIWFALSYGLKVGKMDTGLPFSVWFVTGMIPWLFISESITSSTNSLLDYSYLIKKTPFRVAIIPLIKIFSASIIQLSFVVFLAIFVVAYGYKPDIYWIQLPYLLFSVFVLLTGIGWLTSSINVFVRDMGQVVNVAIGILFWATPIMWPYSMLGDKLKYLALFNPFFYIVEGFRYTFLTDQWIFINVEMTIYFWVTTLIVFISSAIIFKKLSPHFADVL